MKSEIVKFVKESEQKTERKKHSQTLKTSRMMQPLCQEKKQIQEE